MTEAKRFATARDKDGNVVMEFMGLAASDDSLSEALRLLTFKIGALGLADGERGGFFGGAFGYGVNFENETFMMHRYCWCEKAECPWCRVCECRLQFFLDGQACTEDAYQAHIWSPSAPDPEEPGYDEWWARVTSERVQPYCVACQSDHGQRPNFHHKPSGLTISWYKYIGRDNTIGGDYPPSLSVHDLLISCLASIGSELETTITEYQAATDQEAANAAKAAEFAMSDEGRRMFDEMVAKGIIQTFGFGPSDDPQ